MEIYKYGKNLRCGFTTGACAAAAAGAAARLLLSGDISGEEVIILNGQPASFLIESSELFTGGARCAVRKDGGDDIDMTHGLLISAEVRTLERAEDKSQVPVRPGESVPVSGVTDGGPGACIPRGREHPAERISIKGGYGVGRVTKPGLDQPVGSAAINSGPRKMIRSAVASVCDEYGWQGPVTVTISVPEGVHVAEKTFNPILGIEGGISILGTTGIVEPMSEPAVIETIKAEMKVKWLELCEKRSVTDSVTDDESPIAIVPGNQGVSFVREVLGVPGERTVKCSNFIGDAIDYACGLGIRRLIIAGDLGKLVKLAGGIFNTHSRNADCRMDILIRAALEAGPMEADGLISLLRDLDDCVTTAAAVKVLEDRGMLGPVMDRIMEKAAMYVGRRASGTSADMEIRIIMVSNDMEVLGSIVQPVPGRGHKERVMT